MRNKEVEIEIEEVEPHGSKSLVEIVTEVEMLPGDKPMKMKLTEQMKGGEE